MFSGRLTALIISFAAVLSMFGLAAVPVSAEYEERYRPESCSEEYEGSEFYEPLWKARQETVGQPVMDRVVEIALSQEGYKNYATSGVNIDEAKEKNLIWTGSTLRMDVNYTGNTEYTRWAQTYVMDRNYHSGYFDCDWCAIFVSWCMYQAGYYDYPQLVRYYYSYYADPRVEPHYGTWAEAFNFDQSDVYYTSKANGKLARYAEWNYADNTDISPYDLPYKPGGLLFFTWDGSGDYFSHIAIVQKYDKRSHKLYYINGNDQGMVQTRVMDLDKTERYNDHVMLKNSDRIMAYADYYYIEQPTEKDSFLLKTTKFDWEADSSTGLSFYTNSDSKTIKISTDDGLAADYKNKGLSITDGQINIGSALLDQLPFGENTIHIKLEDGSFDITVNVTVPTYTPESSDSEQPSEEDSFFKSDHEADVEVTDIITSQPEQSAAESSTESSENIDRVDKAVSLEPAYVEWKRNKRIGITMKTDSTSRTIKLYLEGKELKLEDGDIRIENGIINIHAKLLNRVAKKGRNSFFLRFEDGKSDLIVNVTEPDKILVSDKESYEWARGDSVTVKTNSDADSVMVSNDDGKSKKLDVSGGKFTLTTEVLEELLTDGDNALLLDFTDGSLVIGVLASGGEASEEEVSSQLSDQSKTEVSGEVTSKEETSSESSRVNLSDKGESSGSPLYIMIGIVAFAIAVAAVIFFMVRRNRVI